MLPTGCDICVFVELFEEYTVQVMTAFAEVDSFGWSESALVRRTTGCCEFVENFWNYLGDYMPDDEFTRVELDGLLSMCWMDYASSLLFAETDPLVADGVKGMEEADQNIVRLFELCLLDASLGLQLPDSWR